MDEGDETALTEIARSGTVLVTIDRRKDADGRWLGLVQRTPGATAAGRESHWSFFRVPAPPVSDSPGCTGPPLAVAEVSGPPASGDLRTLLNGDASTAWVTDATQRAGDTVTIRFARQARPCAITLSVGPGPEVYPRALAVETSLDGNLWKKAYEGKMGGMTVAAALAQPAESPITIPVAAEPANLLRMRLLISHPVYPWVITKLVVNGEP
jgi:hypothetical protein